MNKNNFVQKNPLLLILSISLILIGFSSITFAQKVRLRSQINPNCTRPDGSGTDLRYADIYADGNIAVQGSFGCRGVFIYDVSDADNPTLSSHYNPGNSVQFLEAIVVGNRGYFGSGNGGGVHIVDLSDPANPQLLGTVDPSSGNGFSSIHEMVVDGNLLYENFNGFSNKLIKVINISNPANPVFVRDINPTEVRWVHAMHIRGNRMFTSGWGNNSTRARTEIFDITNIASAAPTLLGFVEDASGLTAGNRMHSAWTSEDGNFLYSCRETNDETGDVRVYDITDPAVPMLVNSLTMQDLGLFAVTPHNPVVKGNYLYVAWYQAGIQVFDITEPAAPRKVGEYDTYPQVFAPTEEEKSLVDESFDVICGNENLQNLLPNTYDGNWAVYPFLGEDKVLAGDLTNGLFVLDITDIMAPVGNRVSDFDGDGRTDFSKYTPSNGNWVVEKSSDGSVQDYQFGIEGDRIEAGDYDGDGKADFAVWRPSNGVWYIANSSDGTFDIRQFGLSSDKPVTADYDADGRTDIAVYRPETGVWYIWQSTLGIKIIKWGIETDIPLAGDFEGDGKADLGIYRPSEGNWYVLQSSNGLPMIAHFGISTDKPLSADFDGDEKADLAVYRPSEGNWYIFNSFDSSLTIFHFGIAEDMPIPSDFDGDGKADISVFRPSENNWYRINSGNGSFGLKTFGQSGDIPSPSSVQP